VDEFRYTGVFPGGKVIQGTLVAANRREAMAIVQRLSAERRFTLKQLQRKDVYLYRVQRPGEKPVRGEQKAFSREELERAFQRAGFRVLSITKKIRLFQRKPSSAEVVTFIRLSADLIREKLSYDEVLGLLQAEASSPALRQMIKEVRRDLQDGLGGRTAFRKQQRALGPFAAYMLGLATGSGNMAEVYESTAKFLERNHDFRKALRKALIMPLVTVVALLGAVLFYVGYIFPKTAEMFARMKIELPPMTRATLEFSRWLQANYLYLIIGAVLFLIGISPLWTTERGRCWRDRMLIRLPVLGSLFHKTSIEIFCRVFYCLYSGSGNNMECIRVAAEACRNKYMEKRIKEIAIPMMLKEGKGLVPSLRATGVFTENCLSRFRSGAETGTLRKSALQVAKFYERETTYRLQAIVDWIQVVVALFITVVLAGLTIVSSEAAVMQPQRPTMRPR